MDTIDDMTPESGWLGQMSDDLSPEWWKRSSFGDDYEGRAEEAEDAQALLDKEASEALRKKRNSLFQTDSGSSGVVTEGVGARDTYFGN